MSSAKIKRDEDAPRPTAAVRTPDTAGGDLDKRREGMTAWEVRINARSDGGLPGRTSIMKRDMCPTCWDDQQLSVKVTDVVCELPLGLVRRAKEKRIRRKWGQPVGLLFWAKRASIEGFIHPNSTEDLESDNSNPKEVEGRAKLGS